MKQPRLLIADDHKPVLDELRRLLESEFDVVGTAEDGESLIAAASVIKPDVILLDLSMPHVDGFEAARSPDREGEMAGLVLRHESRH